LCEETVKILSIKKNKRDKYNCAHTHTHTHAQIIHIVFAHGNGVLIKVNDQEVHILKGCIGAFSILCELHLSVLFAGSSSLLCACLFCRKRS